MKKLEMCKKALINEKMYDIREMQKKGSWSMKRWMQDIREMQKKA